jgi:hypothetical protein
MSRYLFQKSTHKVRCLLVTMVTYDRHCMRQVLLCCLFNHRHL